MAYAIITGATSGIGMEFAKIFAKKGFDLIITGRQKEKISEFAKQLELNYKIKVEQVLADFSNKKDLNLLIKKINSKEEIQVLINNAGFGNNKGFLEDSLENHLKMVEVHINAVIRLTNVVSKKMILKKRGIIVNVSSLAAFFEIPNSEMYSATKSFIKSFTKSRSFELKKHNIKIQCLCPGFTKTNFHKNKKIDHLFPMSSKNVVKTSLKNLDKIIYIPGKRNKLILGISRLIPKKILQILIKRHI